MAARVLIILVMLVGVVPGCGGTAPTATSAAAPIVAPEPLLTRPHDPRAFTQGLVWDRGRIFESTGLYGASSVREVNLRTGRVIRRRALDPAYFGEGLALVGSRLIQLTWRERTAFVWDRDTFRPLGRFRYTGEGWGISPLGGRLVMSDGTATLRILDPRTFRVVRRVRVTDDGRPVRFLNELEVVRGEVWANVWQTDEVVVVNPSTGRVRVRLDLSGLRARLPAGAPVDVLNGIAWDRSRDRLLVTGKLWPRLFEIPSALPAGPAR